MRFEEFNLDPSIMDGISGLGFEEATPVQEQAIPQILQGKDLIACAQTGTGKTAAYLLPVMQKLLEKDSKKTKALIIVPTRELASQIDQNLEAIAYFAGISSVAVYGGRDSKGWDRQKRAIQGGVEIIIATPGRFKLHYSLGYMDLSEVEFLILDEADKMLDMGFFGDILEITSYLSDKPRQTLMFSATMPPKIRKLAKKIMNDPAEVSLEISKPAAGVKQEAFVVYPEQKIRILEHILLNREIESMIIFASSKVNVDRITEKLNRLKFDARAIHSDRDQSERMATLTAFKNKQFPIVVATDVLSRGIDVDNLSHVLNFDVPLDAEDYVHRVGRTARASAEGEAITFISPDDMFRFAKIEDLIEREVPKPDLPESIGEGPKYTKGRRSGGRGRGGSRGGNRSQQRGRGGDRRGGGGKPRDGQKKDWKKSSRPKNRRRPQGPKTGNPNQPEGSRPSSQQSADASEAKKKQRNRRRRRKPKNPGGPGNPPNPQSSE